MRKAKFVKLTPAMVKKFLEANKENSAPGRGAVDRMVKQMKAGNWELSSPIMIQADGTVIDGLRRLRSCVEADVAFDTILIEGLTREAACRWLQEARRGGSPSREKML